MQIPKIQLTTPKIAIKQNNNISFARKIVQPDSFINAPKRKCNKNDEVLFSVASRLANERNPQIDVFSVASRIAREKNDEINEYVRSSKKELRNLKRTAKAHKKQCLGILKKAEKYGYSTSIDADEYNITFGKINPRTNKPASVNIWKEGRLVQQYTINSLKPFHAEVYDCEYPKRLIEEFLINDEGLVNYVAIKPQEKTAELVIAMYEGFYKEQGDIDPEGSYVSKNCTMKKSKALTFEPKGYSYYTEYQDCSKESYKYDKKQKFWKMIYYDGTQSGF